LGQLRQINLATSFYRRWFWESDTLPADVQTIAQNFEKETGLPAAFFDDWGHAWHRDPAQMGGGAFTDMGSHHVDRMLWLAGAPAVEVVAMTESAGLPVDCFVNVQARLDNGVIFSMTSADAMPQGLLSGQRHLMIVGDEGVLTDDTEGRIWLHRDGERQQLVAALADRTEAAAFVAAILDQDTNYPQAIEGAYAVEFVEAMYRSAAEGKIIKIGHKNKRG
jgi:predicted dehydrogenase